MIQSILATKDSASHIIVEFNDDYIKYNDEIGCERVTYSSIEKLRIVTNFIEIGYKNRHSFYIPLYAFADELDFMNCYTFIEKAVQNKDNYEFNSIGEGYSFNLEESDIKNFNYYFYGTEAGKSIIQTLDKFLLLFSGFVIVFLCMVVLTFTGYKYFVYLTIGCVLGILLAKFIIIKNRMRATLIKNEIEDFKKSNHNHEITVTLKESGIEFWTKKYIFYLRYSSIDNVVESNDLILFLKKGIAIKNIPARIFDSNKEKENFINLLKDKCKID